MTDPTEPTPATAVTEATSETPPTRRFQPVRTLFAPVRRTLHKIPHPPWRSRRGVFIIFVLFGGFGAVAAVGGVTAIHYSETSAFCGMCHTMDPELKAYAMSPHKEVKCAECHVEPGAAGFIKAKANGTKQLIGIMTGNFPTPIPPPDHADLPSVKDTCLECHSLNQITENGGPMKLVLRPRYRLDETNTRESVAVLLRPGGLGEAGGARGVHWHVQQTVTYTSKDIRAQKIDLVEFKGKDGTIEQFIAGTEVGVSTDVKPDIDRLKSSETNRQMDCIDCHNRVGHAVASPDQAVDEAMAAGKISADLPFIKRDSVALLNGNYASLDAADKAITGLRNTYASKYPLVFKSKNAQVTGAIDELKSVYRLIATPAMKVQAKTYPDNLGHQTSPGCFRCHDGAHFLVVKGKITNEKIPSECSTCHTFPQVGANASSFPLGAKPDSHKDRLYVFNHKNVAKSLNPTGTTCGACHTKTYCENCHKSGAVKVKHDTMLYNHAGAIKTAGGTQSCNYCHLPVYCATCHKKPVLDPGAQPLAIAVKPTS
jgi:nitrate/TMAO reductase-like tetraheme cytochrome c subunit